MGLFFDPNHLFDGHVQGDLQQFDAHHAHIGGTELHGDQAFHFGSDHQLLGTSDHHSDGSLFHYDNTHKLVGTTQHHGGVAYHFDGSHHLVGTEQEFGGRMYSFDAHHQLAGTQEPIGLEPLQQDLASAFRRLF